MYVTVCSKNTLEATNIKCSTPAPAVLLSGARTGRPEMMQLESQALSAWLSDPFLLLHIPLSTMTQITEACKAHLEAMTQKRIKNQARNPVKQDQTEAPISQPV
jgi:hypothetical protein